MNVRIRHQAETTQALDGQNGPGKSCDGSGIENITPQQRGGHVQMVLDQETDFVFFLCVELKSQRGGIQRLEAPDHMIRVRHAFSDVMEKQRKHEEFAAFERLPKIGEMRRTLILWLTELLQMLDRAQRMLVHRVTVIKIAHDERIDGAKFREHLGQQSQPVHRPQRNRRIARREQFPELWPKRRCLWSCFPRPLPDLSHGVFGFAAELHAGPRGLAQQRSEEHTSELQSLAYLVC